MSDKLKLTYKNTKLKIMLGKKELPLNALIDPAVIVLSADKLPSLRFEMLIDSMTIDDIDDFGRFVTKEDLSEPKPYQDYMPTKPKYTVTIEGKKYNLVEEKS